MKNQKILRNLAIVSAFSLATTTQAFIDFETDPLGSATASPVGDNNVLNFESIYEFSKTMPPIEFQFGIDNDGGFTVGNPATLASTANFRFEATGADPVNGYITNQAGNSADNDIDSTISGVSHGHGFEDTDHDAGPEAGPNPDNIGFFLRGPNLGAGEVLQQVMFGNNGNGNAIAFIQYAEGPDVLEAGGQIWDIDAQSGVPQEGTARGNEQWRVSAWDANLNLINSDTSPIGTIPGVAGTSDGNTATDDAGTAGDAADAAGTTTFNGDGIAWVFNVGSATNTIPIKFITMEFIGTKLGGIGLAFDNFDGAITVVPETSTYALILGGLALGFVAYRRRK